MYPIIEFPWLPVRVPAYQALILLAVVVCLWIGPRWAQAREGVDPRRTRWALLVLAIVVFAGGRLHFLMNQWADWRGRPLAALAVWSGGFHAGGAIMALALATPVVFRGFSLPVSRLADGCVPMVGLGIAIARLGCFLHGCCFGTECAWPWCLAFPRGTPVYALQASLGRLPAAASHAAPVHPLQLYFASVGLLLTAVGLWLYPRKRYHGEVALVALLLYSVSAAVLECFRADYGRVYWGPLPQLEWTALAMTVASAGALGIAGQVHKSSSRSRHHTCGPTATTTPDAA